MRTDAHLQAGVARATVTPPCGIDMQGFAARGPATGVHDDLYVTALSLDAGAERAALVAADLLFFPAEFTAKVRAETERRTGIPAHAVALTASHTHYGPLMDPRGRPVPPDVAAYHANLVHLIAGAVEEAVQRMQPVQAGVARGQCAIGVNRRERKPDGTIILGQNPDGPIDRELIVVRLDTAAGAPLAVLVNFAVHGVCQHAATRTLSADFVAPMRRRIEDACPAKTLYLQGACGNINPSLMERSFEPAEKAGTELGLAVLDILGQAVPQHTAGLATVSREIDFPAKTFGSVQEAQAAVEKTEAELASANAKNAAPGLIAWTEQRLEQARRALEGLQSGLPLPPVKGEVMSMRFGHTALSMAPGEIFNEIGVTIKRRSPLPDTLFAGYANGSIGYMPVPAAYPEGGYEVDRACRIGPESADILIAEALSQLQQLAGASS
ncbi:MAG: hypothetical protein JXR37_16910 [Kiritimatiellae bacterium]|nr:hypothetical protein [Kiritimatiellia bacterium]